SLRVAPAMTGSDENFEGFIPGAKSRSDYRAQSASEVARAQEHDASPGKVGFSRHGSSRAKKRLRLPFAPPITPTRGLLQQLVTGVSQRTEHQRHPKVHEFSRPKVKAQADHCQDAGSVARQD